MCKLFFNRITKCLKTHYKYYSNGKYIDNHKLKPPWNVLFFGTDEFSLASLHLLHVEFKAGDLLSNLEIVTSIKSKRNAVEKYASQEKLAIHNWPNDPGLCDRFHFGIVVSFGHLIPSTVITRFPLGMLNVHASLLPRWRGAAPIVHTIANGDEITGVTIMKIKPNKFDIGEIVAQESIDVSANVKMPVLYNLLAQLGAKALLNTLRDLPGYLDRAIPQPEYDVTLAPKVSSKMAKINWATMTAKDVYNLDRALTGLFHLTSKFNNIPVKLLNISVIKDRTDNTIQNGIIIPGHIKYGKEEKCLEIYCADGNRVRVKTVIVPGKKMSATDFNNGFISKEEKHLRLFR